MMPSSRVEVWVPPSKHDECGNATTKKINTGADGDDWPEADLAHVTFSASSGTRPAALSVSAGSKASSIVHRPFRRACRSDVRQDGSCRSH